jgi:hypothetical protein
MLLSMRDWMLSGRDAVEAGCSSVPGERVIGRTIMPSSVLTRPGVFSSSTRSMSTDTSQLYWPCAGNRPSPSGHPSALF